MNVQRRFDNKGATFEKMFQDLINTKIEDFVKEKYRNDLPERSAMNDV